MAKAPDKRNTGQPNSQGKRGASGGGNEAGAQARSLKGQTGADEKNAAAVRVAKLHDPEQK
jgi:hypothetical protein